MDLEHLLCLTQRTNAHCREGLLQAGEAQDVSTVLLGRQVRFAEAKWTYKAQRPLRRRSVHYLWSTPRVAVRQKVSRSEKFTPFCSLFFVFVAHARTVSSANGPVQLLRCIVSFLVGVSARQVPHIEPAPSVQPREPFGSLCLPKSLARTTTADWLKNATRRTHVHRTRSCERKTRYFV